MSIKDNARRALVMTTMAALSTSFFTGCNNQELPKPAELDLDSELYSSRVSSSEDTSSDEDTLAVSSESSNENTSSDKDNDNCSTSGGTNILEAVVSSKNEQKSPDSDNNDEESSNKGNNDEDVSGDVSANIKNSQQSSDNEENNQQANEDKPAASNSGSSSGGKPTSSTEDSRSQSSKEDSRSESSKPQPKWTETPTSGTMYVSYDGIYSRAEALMGSATVRQYSLNDTVEVTAKTNTEYYKLSDNSFIHADFLSSSKTEVRQPEPIQQQPEPVQTQTPTTPAQTPTTPAQPNGTPQNGDVKTENGKTYVYNSDWGWMESAGGVPQQGDGNFQLSGEHIGY